MSKKPIPKQAPAKPGKLQPPKKAPAKKAAAEAKPVNHGARQPVLELPTEVNGKQIEVHPLLWAMENRMPKDASKSDVARTLGVRPQSLYKWERACRKDRNFPVPILRAKQLAEVFRINPAVLRPDAFKAKVTK